MNLEEIGSEISKAPSFEKLEERQQRDREYVRYLVEQGTEEEKQERIDLMRQLFGGARWKPWLICKHRSK